MILCLRISNLDFDSQDSIDAATKDVYVCCCCVMQPVGLGKIAKLINAGKIDSHELITMKVLKVRSHTPLCLV